MKDEKDKVKVIPAADRNKKLSEAALRVAEDLEKYGKETNE